MARLREGSTWFTLKGNCHRIQSCLAVKHRMSAPSTGRNTGVYDAFDDNLTLRTSHTEEKRAVEPPSRSGGSNAPLNGHAVFTVSNPLAHDVPTFIGATAFSSVGKLSEVTGARRRTVGGSSLDSGATALALDAPASRVLISFSFERFFVTFILNLLDPLSIPLVLALYGRNAAWNMSFLRKPWNLSWYAVHRAESP